jgi:hypothetical protein
MRYALMVPMVLACGRAPEPETRAEGPAASAVIIAVTQWAAAIDADSARVAPKRCVVPKAAAEEALVFIQRPNDSSMKLVLEYRNRYVPAARAVEHYFVMRDTLRLFVRADERPGNPATGLTPSHTEDTLWITHGRLARWVDSAGRSHPTNRRSAGYRAENVSQWFGEWLKAVRPCL